VSPVPYSEVEELAEGELGEVLPLHLRFSAEGSRVVGTFPEYFGFRGLELAEGRRFAVLGEAVLGAEVAEALEVGVGGSIVSTPAGAFDVAGSFPLRMSVVGVLAPTATPDDEVVFVDLRTTWVLEGIGHGHDDVADREATPTGTRAGTAAEQDPDAAAAQESGGSLVADPSLLPYTEITSENIDSFHFHGDRSSFPVDAAIVVPRDARAGTLLRGRFEGGERPTQLVVPLTVVDELVDTMFSVRDAVLVLSAGLVLATIATAALVFALSLRLRAAELESMRRIGVGRRRLRAILFTELGAVLLAATLLASGSTLLASRFGGQLIRWLTG
jgi:putative ABC transport system permease protein